MGYVNPRIRNNTGTQIATVDTVKQMLHEMQNPIKHEKLIEADGGAYRAYCFNVSQKIK
ncbi:MAG: hypothetical protein PHX18_03210 [Candidatus Gastranaerophilales bacterium]|nr:hypothetical protein [Candidatus Gastranaerophilales bacterium]